MRAHTDTLKVAISDIATALQGRDYPTSDERVWAQVFTLSSEALFFGHLARHSITAEFRAAALARAWACVDVVEAVPLNSALYGGMAGLGWLLAHLPRIGLVE